MMRKCLWIVPLLLLSAATLGLALPASADTLTSYTLQNVTLSPNGTAGGTFTFDSTSQLINDGYSNINITMTYTNPGSGVTFNDQFSDTGVGGTGPGELQLTDFSTFDILVLYFTPSLAPAVSQSSVVGLLYVCGGDCGDIVLSGSIVASPSSAPVPEIDPQNATSALALLIGAVLVIRGRRRKMTQPECGCERV